jgi:hypothetical protein
MHELMIRHGFQVVPHPTVQSTTHKPDFLVHGSGNEFSLEVTLATDLSAKQQAEESMKAGLYDQINKTNSPDFFLFIKHMHLHKEKQPSAKKLIRFLNEKLKSLDPDTIYKQFSKGGLNSLPSWTYKDDNNRIEFQPIPKSPMMRGKKEVRPIGFFPIESQMSTTAKAIKNAVHEKATRYGKLNSPYLVAVNSLSSWGTDVSDIEEALFGAEQVQLDRHTGEPIAYSRERDGAFIGPNGPKNTRMSGVILGTIVPRSISKTTLTLYHHPQARHPFDRQLLQINNASVENNKIVVQRNIPLRDIFNLKEEWPQI